MNADTALNWTLNWTLNWAGHTGLDISILIVLILMCRRPFVKLFGARAAYALWALPLLRLVLPEIPITLPRPSWMQPIVNAPTEIITYTNLETFVAGPVVASPASAQVNWQLPVIAIWLGVAVVWFTVQLLRQHNYIKNIQADASSVSQQVQHKLSQACETLALNSAPDICVSASNAGPMVGPMVAGVFRPIIILPKNFESDFNDRQQFFALTHELAHIKRRDLWAAFGALLFRALNWPNPLVHLCAVKFRTDQEAACDAYVLNIIGGGSQTRQSYAATLIHSATLAAKVAAISTKNSTRTPRTPSNQSVLVNPLCLTIYHPLKERLMTLKTSKINSTILSRIGVGAFLVAALAATAPITIASASDGPVAETPKVKTETKKVMKWVVNNDGAETTKHIEINVEDGVTTAYSIDKDGNQTEIDMSEVEGMHGLEGLVGLAGLSGLDGLEGLEGLAALEGLAGMKVFVTDGMMGKKHIKIMKGEHMKGMKGDHMIIMKDFIKMDGERMLHMKDGEHSNIIIKRISIDGDGADFDMADFDIDNNVMFMGAQGNHAAAMVGAAQSLLEQAETMTGGKELSSKTLKKLKKARKALKEAQEALEAEE